MSGKKPVGRPKGSTKRKTGSYQWPRGQGPFEFYSVLWAHIQREYIGDYKLRHYARSRDHPHQLDSDNLENDEHSRIRRCCKMKRTDIDHYYDVNAVTNELLTYENHWSLYRMYFCNFLFIAVCAHAFLVYSSIMANWDDFRESVHEGIVGTLHTDMTER